MNCSRPNAYIRGLGLLLGYFAAIALLGGAAWADESKRSGEPETLGSFRAKYADAKKAPKTTTGPASLRLGEGSELVLSAPKNLESAAQMLRADIAALHHDYEIIFGAVPPVKAKIRLMSEDDFFLSTGAPSWTNAMYYRGEILIPVSRGKKLDLQNLKRAARHEYSHALVHSLSGGRCPGWLDEGLAQWAEGDENAALGPALKKWLRNNSPVPLALLQGGFTKLKNDMVPAAYAQSLFATRSIIKTFGFGAIKDYFFELRTADAGGAEMREAAFAQAFAVSLGVFEIRLRNAITAWGLGQNLGHSHSQREL